MSDLKRQIYVFTILLFILMNAIYGQSKAPFIKDFRVNEQGGNSVKYLVRTAINNNNISMVVWYDYREGTPNVYAQLENSNGELIGGNIKVNSPETNNNYIFADVSYNEDNQFLVVWADGRHGYAIYGQLIDENGNFIGDNFIINDENITSYQTNPAIASNGKEFIVVWSDERNGYLYDIYGQKLDKNGNKIGNNFIVNTDSQRVSNYSPDVALNKNGDFITSWYYYKNGFFTPESIVRNKDNYILSPQIEVSDSIYGSVNNYYPQAATSDSGFAVVWYRKNNSNNYYVIVGQLLNSIGEKIDSNFVINEEGDYSAYSPCIGADSSGNFIVTWYDYRNKYAQIYSQKFVDNKFSGANFKVTEDESTSTKSPIACAMNDSDYLISAWLDYGNPTEYSILSRLIDSTEQPINASIRMDMDSLSSTESDPTLAVMDDGSFVIAWTDKRDRNYKTFFQRYDAEGNPLGTNVNNDDKNSQYNPSIAQLKDGNFLLVWREYSRNTYNQYEVLGQKYFNTGEKIGDTFIISSTERKGDVYSTDVCSNSNGEVVVTWQKRFSNLYYTVAKKYKADGSIAKDCFLVTNDTTSYNGPPKAGIDSLGNFAITYHTYKNNNYDIFLDRFNSAGEQIDSGIVVDDDNSLSTQYDPDISVNPAGDCMVAWYDYRNQSGIYFQKYKNIGSVDSFEKVDSNMAVSDSYMAYGAPTVSMQDNGEVAISWSKSNGSIDNTFYDLSFRLFNSDLTPLTDIMPATISQERDQMTQDIVFKDNKIFNVWADNHEPGVGYDIWANVYNISDLVTGVNDNESKEPTSFKLSQNYPNPFNPTTRIKYSIPVGVQRAVQLKVYDILGREVATLVNETKSAGNYEATFNASSLASGVYFYRLRAGKFVQTKKMILLR